MRKLYVERPLTPGETLVVGGSDGRHLARVLRAGVGDALTVCAMGTEFSCTVTAVTRETVTVSVGEGRPAGGEPGVSVTLCVGLPKAEKLEHVVQKGVELGADRILPFAAERSVVRDGGSPAKALRRAKIAAEAAKQCGRGRVPEVCPATDFTSAAAEAKNADLALLCYELGGRPLSEVLREHPDARRIAVMTGPEGGISAAEFEQAAAAGWIPVTLGSRILRCETAPLAALTAILYEYGEF